MLTPLVIISIGFSAFYFLMAVYLSAGWLKLKKAEKKETGKPQPQLPFVSIIIPVRNESECIRACLESVLKQNYPQELFEVIVIDDYSTDSTLRIAREFETKNLLVLDLQQYLGNPGEYVPNKKKAIALGIKNSKGDLIITTDGDCTRGENWLSAMVNHYMCNSFKLLTGPVTVKPARNPFAWFQQLDVLNLSAIGGATMRSGFPTMCNGANLMYSKQTFLDVEGFKGNHEVPSGDDIFLMQKVNARFPGSIGYVKNFDACVFTKAEKSIGGFISQRIRWVSKSKKFIDLRTIPFLFFVYVFHLLIIVNGIVAVFRITEMSWLPLAITGGVKLFADLLFNVPVTIFFRKWYMLLLLPFTEVFYLLYVPLIGLMSLSGRYRWKGRLVK